jgi:hypothetical protein
LTLAVAGVGHVPTAWAQTADSILANKKQRNAPVLAPTGSSPERVDRPGRALKDAIVQPTRAERVDRPSQAVKDAIVCAPAVQRPSPNEV